MDVDIQLFESISLRGDLDEVRDLIEVHHANPHYLIDAPLRLAAKNGHLDIVKYLVENHRANVYAKSDNALWGACRAASLSRKFEQYDPVIRYLMSKGADIHSHEDEVLRWAICSSREDNVTYVLAQGLNINNALIMAASMEGAKSMTHMLLDLGAKLPGRYDPHGYIREWVEYRDAVKSALDSTPLPTELNMEIWSMLFPVEPKNSPFKRTHHLS